MRGILPSRRWQTAEMPRPLRIAVLMATILLPAWGDPACVIDLGCAECIPDNMPVVTSHEGGGAGGTVAVRGGDAVTLWCPGGKFLAYPLRHTLIATCEAGRYRVTHDGTLRHLLDLGCQENVFEDVLHEVVGCPPPLQGRAYQIQEAAGGNTRHLAELCYDAERALCTHVHCAPAPHHDALPLPPHRHAAAPLSLLGNFNHMFDAATRHQAILLYSSDDRLNGILRELLKHDQFAFGAQSLTGAKLLAPHYFSEQNARVTNFASNQFACWRSVADGNLRHTQRDVARLAAVARGRLHVHAGTHGTLSLRTGSTRTDIYLKPAGRFPVPKYVWTVLHDTFNKTAIAIVVLNDPYVTVDEIPETMFCANVCDDVPWLHELRMNRNYETPVYGLVFCCQVHDFIRVVTEMPAAILKNVPKGSGGLLTEILV